MTYDPYCWSGEEVTQLITPDGKIYSLDGIKDRSILVQFNGQGTPPIEYATQQGPLQHGQTVISYRLQPRILQGLLRWSGRNRKELWDQRSALLDAIRPNRINVGSVPSPCVLRTILPDYTIRDIDVLISDGPGFETGNDAWDEFAFEEPIRFIAHDPTFYDPTALTVTATIGAIAGLSVPISVPLSFGSGAQTFAFNVTYTGSWLTYPVITLTGPLTAAVITNTTTDEEIQFTKPLASGAQAVIDTRFGIKKVYDPSLPETDPNYNLIGFVSGDLGTFHLDPAPQAAGGLNVLQIYMASIGSSGSISFTYNTRFFGI